MSALSGQGAIVPVVLASGPVLQAAVQSAVNLLGDPGWPAAAGRPIVVLSSGRFSDRWSATVRSVRPDGGTGASPVIRPRRGAVATVRGRLAGVECVWINYPLPGSGEHFAEVSIPADIAGAAALCLVVDVADRSSVLEALAGYTRPRQAVAARLDRRRLGLAAELAAPLRPRLILLHMMRQEQHLVVATADRIAAELVYLALREWAAGDDSDRIGPWEDRLVQRATELDLGVHHPTELAIVLAPDDAGAASFPEELIVMRDRLLARLGIPEHAEEPQRAGM